MQLGAFSISLAVKDIEASGFYFEYSEGSILGRINIDGKKSGANLYSLVAKLTEKQDT